MINPTTRIIARTLGKDAEVGVDVGANLATSISYIAGANVIMWCVTLAVLAWHSQASSRQVPVGTLLWRGEKRRWSITCAVGIGCASAAMLLQQSPLEQYVGGVFLVASVLATGQGAILLRWAVKSSKHTYRTEAVLCEVRSGVGRAGVRLWERYVVIADTHAKLEETASEVSHEAEDEQHIQVMHRGERRLGTPLMLYFEGRWQQTSPLEAGGVEVVRNLLRNLGR